MDIRRGLPFKDCSVDAIYGGEILEHLLLSEANQFLSEARRVLAPGGVLRLRVPDGFLFWKNYVNDFERTFARPREQWDDEHTRWWQMFFRDICVTRPGLHSMGHFHKWMYDEISLIRAFEHAGFEDVERMNVHDSRIADIQLVETRDNLIVEGVKR